jgi:uncharacterized protein YjbI with pentapeptide repeats
MCKLEYFGNCDPETKDQEYCIFHKPNKNEEEAREFWRKFLERFKPKKEKIFIEDLGKEIERFVFKDKVDCSGFVFPKIPKDVNFSFRYAIFEEAIFANAIFEDVAHFSWSCFRKSADFSEATFESDANFYGASFGTTLKEITGLTGAIFVNTTFKGEAIFNNTTFKFANFTEATFKKDADFGGAIFTNIIFRSATFEGKAYFTNAKFKFVDFNYAKFKGDADFKDVNKKDEDKEFSQVSFGEAEFENSAWFTSARFGCAWFGLTKFGKYTNFSEAEFTITAQFVDTLFRGYVEFIGTKFQGDVTFEGAEFLGKVTFKEEKNQQKIYAKFFGKLSFLNTNFNKGINIELPKDCFKLPDAEAEACRVQRLYYERNGIKDKADEMFRRERRASRKAKVRQAKEQLIKSKGIKSKLKAIINLLKVYGCFLMEILLADLTCEYGTNWERPVVLWIFTVLILFPLLYLLTKSVPNAYDFPSYLYFSIVTATTLGYGDLHPIGVGRALASVEAIFGTFMWAVFLAVFARKYMR